MSARGKFIFIMLVLSVFILRAPLLGARDYYLAQNYFTSDEMNGTIDATIKVKIFIASAIAQDKIPHFQTGTYLISDMIEVKDMVGTAGDLYVIRGNSSAYKATFKFTDNSKDGLKLNRCNYIKIYGIRLEYSDRQTLCATSGKQLLCVYKCNNFLISCVDAVNGGMKAVYSGAGEFYACKGYYSEYKGILIDKCENILVRGCNIYGCVAGIHVESSIGCTVSECLTRDTFTCGIRVEDSENTLVEYNTLCYSPIGIAIYGPVLPCKNTTVCYNILYRLGMRETLPEIQKPDEFNYYVNSVTGMAIYSSCNVDGLVITNNSYTSHNPGSANQKIIKFEPELEGYHNTANSSLYFSLNPSILNATSSIKTAMSNWSLNNYDCNVTVPGAKYLNFETTSFIYSLANVGQTINLFSVHWKDFSGQYLDIAGGKTLAIDVAWQQQTWPGYLDGEESLKVEFFTSHNLYSTNKVYTTYLYPLYYYYTQQCLLRIPDLDIDDNNPDINKIRGIRFSVIGRTNRLVRKLTFSEFILEPRARTFYTHNLSKSPSPINVVLTNNQLGGLYEYRNNKKYHQDTSEVITEISNNQ